MDWFELRRLWVMAKDGLLTPEQYHHVMGLLLGQVERGDESRQFSDDLSEAFSIKNPEARTAAIQALLK